MERRNGGGGHPGEGYSSSVDLSSAPDSEIAPSLSPTPKDHDSNNDGPGSANSTIRVGSYPHHAGENAKKSASGPTPATTSQRHNTKPAATEPKVKKPRKKPEPKPDAEKKEKPARKPRTSSTANPNPRKKQKVENTSSAANVKVESVQPARQSKITDLVTPTPSAQQTPKPTNVPATAQSSQTGNNEAITDPTPISQQPTPQPQPAAPPRTGGTNYDPIRSSFLTTSTQSSPSQPSISVARRPPSRASESPALASLMNPQPTANSPNPAPGTISYPSLPTTASTENHSVKPAISSPSNRHVILDPTPFAPAPAPVSTPAQPAKQAAEPARPPDGPPSVMSVDSEPAPQLTPKPTALPKKPSSGNPSNAPSPKPPVRAKDIAPPLPQGSGLIQSALFGGSGDAPTANGTKATPNIIIEVPLLGQSNKVINFARLAEEKYGFAALHPRVAAQQERLARVAAASAALERNNSAGKKGNNDSAAENESGDGDDMSLDLSDNEGDVAMSGLGGENSGGEGTATGEDGKKKKPKRKKIEEYDRDDPFVDDSEMVWEATAAASKDGFFVYYGPLVPEGEKPSLERADGTTTTATSGRSNARSRRGRGGGTGSRSNRNKESKDTAAKDKDASKDTSKDDNTNSTHNGTATEKEKGTASKGEKGAGGGTGKAGGSTTAARKSRVTKAEKEAREKEKVEREKILGMNMGRGIAAKETTSTGSAPVPPTNPTVSGSVLTGAAPLGSGQGIGHVELAPRPPITLSQ